jgi:hypothetical protein
VACIGHGWNNNSYPVRVDCILEYEDGTERESFFDLEANAIGEQIVFAAITSHVKRIKIIGYIKYSGLF